MRAEREIGSLELGKRADFIILDRNLLTCKVDEVKTTQVLSTWLDGNQCMELYLKQFNSRSENPKGSSNRASFPLPET